MTVSIVLLNVDFLECVWENNQMHIELRLIRAFHVTGPSDGVHRRMLTMKSDADCAYLLFHIYS